MLKDTKRIIFILCRYRYFDENKLTVITQVFLLKVRNLLVPDIQYIVIIEIDFFYKLIDDGSFIFH